MGCKNRVEEETSVSPSSSLSEALLFATMYIIGLPVDVHVKDGSVYSGMFYTACVEKDYGKSYADGVEAGLGPDLDSGIVLKRAKMIKRGKSNANIANGSVVETLVILSGDLVQVVAKGVSLPSDGIAHNVMGDNVESIAGVVCTSKDPVGETKKSTKGGMDQKRINQRRSLIHNENGYAHAFSPAKAEKEHERRKVPQNPVGNAVEVEQGKIDRKNGPKKGEAFDFFFNERQAGEDNSKELQNGYEVKLDFHQEADVQSSNSSLDGSLALVKPMGEVHANMTSKLFSIGVSCDTTTVDDHCSESLSSTDTSLDTGFSAPPNPVSDVNSESCCSSVATSTETAPPQSSESNRGSKEFKLNPGAKVFSPSFANPISATPAALTVANMAYIPSNSAMVGVASGLPDVGTSPFAPRSSAPSKFVPYTNLTGGNGGSGSQFSQPIVGHIGNRAQPLRYAGQYHPIQAAPAFLNPNSQVLVGRLGQLVYMQPFSQDLVQGAPAISQVTARPLLTTHQVPFPKHQGTAAGQALQLCMPQPLVAGGQQPYAVPSHIPLLQPPFPADHATPIPGPNGYFGAKFP